MCPSIALVGWGVVHDAAELVGPLLARQPGEGTRVAEVVRVIVSGPAGVNRKP